MLEVIEQGARCEPFAWRGTLGVGRTPVGFRRALESQALEQAPRSASDGQPLARRRRSTPSTCSIPPRFAREVGCAHAPAFLGSFERRMDSLRPSGSPREGKPTRCGRPEGLGRPSAPATKKALSTSARAFPALTSCSLDSSRVMVQRGHRARIRRGHEWSFRDETDGRQQPIEAMVGQPSDEHHHHESVSGSQGVFVKLPPGARRTQPRRRDLAWPREKTTNIRSGREAIF